MLAAFLTSLKHVLYQSDQQIFLLIVFEVFGYKVEVTSLREIIIEIKRLLSWLRNL